MKVEYKKRCQDCNWPNDLVMYNGKAYCNDTDTDYCNRIGMTHLQSAMGCLGCGLEYKEYYDFSFEKTSICGHDNYDNYGYYCKDCIVKDCIVCSQDIDIYSVDKDCAYCCKYCQDFINSNSTIIRRLCDINRDIVEKLL